MTTILCPTRGGEASIPNQDFAIRLAAERDARLVFLYVSNIHFLDYTAGPIELTVIENQLDEVGDFILRIATERAGKLGVAAVSLVMRGEFQAVLKEVIASYKVATVVVGSGLKGTRMIPPDYNQRLFEHLSQDLGVEVLVTRDGVVTERYPPDGEQDQPDGPGSSEGESDS